MQKNRTNESTILRYATFNILADAYLDYGDYTHVEPELLHPQARTPLLIETIDSLAADVVSLQEADEAFVNAIEADGEWQTFWSQKTDSKPDGCLTLVRPGIEVADFQTLAYSDASSHIAQILRIGQTTLANTHIKWAAETDEVHAGVGQTKELLEALSNTRAAIIVGDSNDRPNGPVRTLIEQHGFLDLYKEEPTARVNQKPVALDVVAIRGLAVRRQNKSFYAAHVPSRAVASDHVPLTVDIYT